jgi:putative transposase
MAARVWHDLRALGEACGQNRVSRLMQLAKLQARRKRRRLPGDTASRLENHIAPNHLQRDFQADGPNQKWVADSPTSGRPRAGYMQQR